MKRLDIQTTKVGNKKLISDSDIDYLRKSISENRETSDYSQYLFDNIDSNETVTRKTSSRSTRDEFGDMTSKMSQQLLDEKDRQIQRLEELLSKEQHSKREIEQGLLAVQGQMLKIHTLLEQPPSKSFWSRLIGR